MCNLKEFIYLLIFWDKITPISEGKKRRNTISTKDIGKKSPKFDKFTTFHFKETKIKITKFRLKVQTSHQKYIARFQKKILLFSRTCSQIWLNPLVEDSPTPPTNYHKWNWKQESFYKKKKKKRRVWLESRVHTHYNNNTCAVVVVVVAYNNVQTKQGKHVVVVVVGVWVGLKKSCKILDMHPQVHPHPVLCPRISGNTHFFTLP